jgi:hypothetical protein
MKGLISVIGETPSLSRVTHHPDPSPDQLIVVYYDQLFCHQIPRRTRRA